MKYMLAILISLSFTSVAMGERPRDEDAFRITNKAIGYHSLQMELASAKIQLADAQALNSLSLIDQTQRRIANLTSQLKTLAPEITTDYEKWLKANPRSPEKKALYEGLNKLMYEKFELETPLTVTGKFKNVVKVIKHLVIPVSFGLALIDPAMAAEADDEGDRSRRSNGPATNNVGTSSSFRLKAAPTSGGGAN